MLVQGLGRISRVIVLGAVGLAGCSSEVEELKLDPGASPFYPGDVAKPAAVGKAQNAPGAPQPDATARAVTDDKASAPSVSTAAATKTLRADEVEKQIRVAQRFVQKGETDKARVLLDEVLAVEPINREALNGRAALALQQTKPGLPLAERAAAAEHAIELARKLRRAYEAPKKGEIGLYAAALSRLAQIKVQEAKLDEALAILQESTDAGLDGLYWARRDETMAPLCSSPKFQQAFRAVKDARLAVARVRVQGPIDKPLPVPFDLKLKSIEGKSVTLADWKGKVVVLDFWGTWCGPCREAIPRLIELSKKYEPDGLIVVGLSYEKSDPQDPETLKGIQEFVKQAGIPYTCLIGDQATIAQIPGFKGFPTSVVLDRSGRVRLLVTENDSHSLDFIEDVVQIVLAEPWVEPVKQK